MRRFEFSLPVLGDKVPSGPNWIHEVKYDGYRMRLERDGKTVRLITKNGADWTSRYPWIVESALRNRKERFILDGEVVVLGVDGVSSFDDLHSRKHDNEAQFYAFDCLALNGDDLRQLPLHMRKTNLEEVLRNRTNGGIFRSTFEVGEIGPELFRAACEMGLEGLVSKDRDRAYKGGRCPHWIKIKNRKHPAMTRVLQGKRP